MDPLIEEGIRRVADEFLLLFSNSAEQEFRGGAKQCLLAVVRIHLLFDKPLPQWTKNALLGAHSVQPKSWDDIFGSFPGLRPKIEEAGRVYLEVRTRIKEGQAVDAGLFEEAAEKLNMSAGTAKRRYYDLMYVFDSARDIVDTLGIPPDEPEKWEDIISFCEVLREVFPAVWEFIKAGIKNEKLEKCL